MELLQWIDFIYKRLYNKLLCEGQIFRRNIMSLLSSLNRWRRGDECVWMGRTTAWYCVQTNAFSRVYELAVPRCPRYIEVTVEFDRKGGHLVSVARVGWSPDTPINEWEELDKYLVERIDCDPDLRLNFTNEGIRSIVGGLQSHIRRISRDN